MCNVDTVNEGSHMELNWILSSRINNLFIDSVLLEIQRQYSKHELQV